MKHVVVHIEKDISTCFECPHFEEMQDMNATIPWCGMLHDVIEGVSPVQRYLKPNQPIPSNCPLPETT